MSIKRKLLKLVKNPKLYFYDFFKKRGIVISLKDQKQNTTLLSNSKELAIVSEKIKYLSSKLDVAIKYAFVNSDILSIHNYLYLKNISQTNPLIIRNLRYLDSYSLFFQNIKYINDYNDSYILRDFNKASALLIHGQATLGYVTDDILKAKVRNIPIFYGEEGFINSIVKVTDFRFEKKYRIGGSLVLEQVGAHFSPFILTSLEKMLNSDRVLSSDDLLRARKNIDKIINCYLSKYNNQPIYRLDIGRNHKKVLVVDQSINDQSISNSGADYDTFQQMLLDAINENKNADIIVKVHPDTISKNDNTIKEGHFKGFPFEKYPNVYIIKEMINPIALLKSIDKVYVVSSQLGFEAMMCNKEVFIYGVPFYAGWGCGICRNKNPKLTERRKKRSVEEIFYFAYIEYTNYAIFETKEVCEIEEYIDYLLKVRASFFKKYNIRDDLSIVEKNVECITTQNKVIDVAFCFNSSYVYPTLVTMLSLLQHNVKGVNYHFHCICDDSVDNSLKMEMKNILIDKKFFDGIDFYHCGSYFLSAKESRIPNIGYSRLVLHKILAHLDKVIYSDSDILYLSSLDELFSLNLGNYYVGATIDPMIPTPKKFEHCVKTYSYFQESLYTSKWEYFHFGMMLMNLKKLRETEIEKEWIYMSSKNFQFQDMDILNISIPKNIKPINSKYCVIPGVFKLPFYKNNDNNKYNIFPENYIIDAKNSPVALHYAGKKPWEDKNVEGAELWWKFVEQFPTLHKHFYVKEAKSRFLDSLKNGGE